MDTKENKMVSFLMSSGKDIKSSKATLVGGALEKTYRRAIEDICDRIETYEVELEAKMLSLVPNTITTNDVVTNKFDADEVMKLDIETGIKEKKDIEYLDIFLSKYVKHFGTFENMEMIERVSPELATKYGTTKTMEATD